MSTLDPNHLILTGENPFIRLNTSDNDNFTTNASFWRIILSPAGPGHVLYVKSELTENRWRIYTDNIAMARWLQQTVQGMLNKELEDLSIPVVDAVCTKEGDPHFFWTERMVSRNDEITMTWYDIGEPLLIHTQPNTGGRKYGVCTGLIPAPRAPPARHRGEAQSTAFKRQRGGPPLTTPPLAFSRSPAQAP